MLAHAQELVYTLSELMPTHYQKQNLEAMFGLFLEAQGHPLPEHCQTKSASALSRFLNIQPWSTREMIRTVRDHAIKQVLSECPKGRKPCLQVIIDLTTLEKRGKFKEFEHLITRKLVDGRVLRHLHQQGQQVRLVGLNFPVTVSWYYLKRDNGRLEKRFVLSTRPLKASTIKWWGKRRWQIEGWFKTAKHRFGLHRFGQGTLLGMYRWFILSLTAFLIAHWTFLFTLHDPIPDWGEAAQTALESLFPQIAVSLILLDIQRLAPLARSLGFDIHISRCKM